MQEIHRWTGRARWEKEGRGYTLSHSRTLPMQRTHTLMLTHFYSHSNILWSNQFKTKSRLAWVCVFIFSVFSSTYKSEYFTLKFSHYGPALVSCNCFIRLQWHLGTSRRSSRSTGDKFLTSNVVNKSFCWVVYLRRNLPTTIWTCDGKCWNVLTKLHVGESLSENCSVVKIHSGQIGQKRNNPIEKPVLRFQMVSFTSQLNIFKELPIYRTGS